MKNYNIKKVYLTSITVFVKASYFLLIYSNIFIFLFSLYNNYIKQKFKRRKIKKIDYFTFIFICIIYLYVIFYYYYFFKKIILLFIFFLRLGEQFSNIRKTQFLTEELLFTANKNISYPEKIKCNASKLLCETTSLIAVPKNIFMAPSEE